MWVCVCVCVCGCVCVWWVCVCVCVCVCVGVGVGVCVWVGVYIILCIVFRLSSGMYLTEAQLNIILNSSFFTVPFTESVVTYRFYRGRTNATVHTLRFNWINEFNRDVMLQQLITYLMTYFPLNSTLLGSINYDILLVNPGSEPKSYYVWRANSNAHSFNEENETRFVLTYDNVYRFATNALNVNIPDLNINFQTSNVQVEKIVAIVFSFVKM